MHFIHRCGTLRNSVSPSKFIPPSIAPLVLSLSTMLLLYFGDYILITDNRCSGIWSVLCEADIWALWVDIKGESGFQRYTASDNFTVRASVEQKTYGSNQWIFSATNTEVFSMLKLRDRNNATHVCHVPRDMQKHDQNLTTTPQKHSRSPVPYI